MGDSRLEEKFILWVPKNRRKTGGKITEDIYAESINKLQKESKIRGEIYTMSTNKC